MLLLQGSRLSLILLFFCLFLPLIPLFFFYCFVLLTSAQAKYERDLEIVVKETNTERDIVMKKVSYVVFCPFCILLSSVCYVFLA